jgi:hypothetical protein
MAAVTDLANLAAAQSAGYVRVQELAVRNGDEDGTHVCLNRSPREGHILLCGLREIGSLACQVARTPSEHDGDSGKSERRECDERLPTEFPGTDVHRPNCVHSSSHSRRRASISSRLPHMIPPGPTFFAMSITGVRISDPRARVHCGRIRASSSSG